VVYLPVLGDTRVALPHGDLNLDGKCDRTDDTAEFHHGAEHCVPIMARHSRRRGMAKSTKALTFWWNEPALRIENVHRRWFDLMTVRYSFQCALDNGSS
jgi:hypothetical protein